jgi:hypothetical protein
VRFETRLARDLYQTQRSFLQPLLTPKQLEDDIPPWNQLSEATKEKKVSQILEMIEDLDGAGYQVVTKE